MEHVTTRAVSRGTTRDVTWYNTGYTLESKVTAHPGP